MIKTIPSCDVCAEDKKLQNGWWITWVDENGFHSDHLDKENMHRVGVKHACSAACNGKFLARWMGSDSLEMEKQPNRFPNETDSPNGATYVPYFLLPTQQTVSERLEDNPVNIELGNSSHVYEGAPIR